jgi:hypothetical protein
MYSIVEAIARQEGFGANANNLPTRDNNPGNIIFGKFAAKYGATKDPYSQNAIFPSVDVGYQAMRDLLGSSSYSNLSIRDAIAKWVSNPTILPTYVKNVSDWTGLDPNARVSDVLYSSGPVNVLDNSSNYGSVNVVDNSSDYGYSSVSDWVTGNDDDSTTIATADVNLAFYAGIGLIGLLIIKLFR